jgi:aspartyl-tRNA(Asn)/glutamyl-tRNA(Gln) amidotransferase subunit A
VSTASNLADCTATELLDLYRRGAATPVEALEAVLARIADQNPMLNAFCLVDAERAIATARASAERWRCGCPVDLLDGVPVSIKDLVLTRDWPTLRGSHTVDASQKWDVDAPIAARLREAGAVLIGKTNTPEFGMKATTDSYRSGVTRNPWNRRMTPGGSSGGAAAAVASGMGPLAVGTDGAGSIRIPCAFCGITGMKPSYGRVPFFPQSAYGTIAHVGPHARNVADLALMLNVVSRPDERDWLSLPYEARDYRVGLNDGVAGLRVAFSPDLGYVKNVEPAVAKAVRAAAGAFAGLGAHVEEVSPGFANAEEIICTLWFVGSATNAQLLSQEQLAKTDPMFRWQAEQGRKVGVIELQQIALRRGELGLQMRRFHKDFDLLLTPAVSVPAFEARPTNDWKIDVETFLGWTPFTYPFNLTGQPAAVVPCGLTATGLPIALQIVGPAYADALVLRAARAYESTRAWKLPVLATKSPPAR